MKKVIYIFLITTILITMLNSFKVKVYAEDKTSIPILQSIKVGTTQYGAGYIYGQIKSNVAPQIKFKSTDGKDIKDVYIEKQENNIYYFDRHLVEISMDKNYIFEITIDKTVQNINLGNDRTIGTYGKYKVEVKNNQLKISKDEYKGIPTVTLKTINLGNTAYGAKYIYGTIEYYETVDGKKVSAKTNPKIVLKSTDGKDSKDVYLEKKENNIFYFDRHIVSSFDMNKEYVFEIRTTNELNTYKDPVKIILGNKDLGLNTNKYKIYTENDKIKFKLETYKGQPIVELKEFNLGITNYGDGYLYGKLTYKEKVNDVVKSSTEIPKIIFKSTDGKVIKDVYINKVDTDTYYFDRHLAGIDTSKEYTFEVYSNDIRNTVKDSAKINFNNVQKQYKNMQYTIMANDNTNLKISKFTYKGDVECKINSFNIGTTNYNGSYLFGTLEYKEYVDGKERNLDYDPVIVFRSTDGKKIYDVYLEKKGKNLYYFDRHIAGLDVSKKYTFVITSGDNRNVSSKRSAILNFNSINKNYSTYACSVNINSNNEFSISKQTYYGVLDSGLFRIAVNTNSQGKYYINGNIDCFEWVNGSKRKLLFNPKIELISTDNKVVRNCYVEYNAGYGSGYQYYFDNYIDGIDTSKEYIIRVTNQDSRNTNTKKSQDLYSSDCYIGRYGNFDVKYKSSKIYFNKNYITSGTYGVSGLKTKGDSRGSDLRYYKLGWGSNVFFATFAVHGFEDNYNHDGLELTQIAEDFVNKLNNVGDTSILSKWTIYILPQANPDGARYGYSNNGPGRHTVYGSNASDGHKGIDLNRCWQTSSTYTKFSGRNYNGQYACSSSEASSLRNFLTSHKSVGGQTVLIDVHGWLTETIGDNQIGSYYRTQFGMSKHISTYGNQYLINWARTSLGSSGKVARTALIELPEYGTNGKKILSHSDVVNSGYSTKFYNATINLLKGLI